MKNNFKIGKEIGDSVVIGHEKNKCLLKCKCGNEYNRSWQYMKICKTYHCLKCENKSRIGKKWKCWTGVGEVSGSYFASIKNSAKNRELSFNITIEYISELFEQQEHKCYFTKRLLVFSSQRQSEKGIEQTASLDRIDSTIGYEIGNVRWVHKYINLMKGNKTDEAFYKICRLVGDYNE